MDFNSREMEMIKREYCEENGETACDYCGFHLMAGDMAYIDHETGSRTCCPNCENKLKAWEEMHRRGEMLGCGPGCI